MADFVRAGKRLINLDQVVDIDVWEAQPERYDECGVPEFATELRVELITTAVEGHYDDGGDYPDTARTEIRPVTIRLRGDEAEDLLGRVYVPSARSVNSYRAPALVELGMGER